MDDVVAYDIDSDDSDDPTIWAIGRDARGNPVDSVELRVGGLAYADADARLRALASARWPHAVGE